MQIQSRISNPRGEFQTPETSSQRTSPRVITSMKDLTWSVFVQRRRRAQFERRALEAVLFPST